MCGSRASRIARKEAGRAAAAGGQSATRAPRGADEAHGLVGLARAGGELRRERLAQRGEGPVDGGGDGLAPRRDPFRAFFRHERRALLQRDARGKVVRAVAARAVHGRLYRPFAAGQRRVGRRVRELDGHGVFHGDPFQRRFLRARETVEVVFGLRREPRQNVVLEPRQMRLGVRLVV